MRALDEDTRVSPLTCVFSTEPSFYSPAPDRHMYIIQGATDSQKIKIKKRTKTPRITDEGWNSQKRLSDPVEKKMKEGKRRKKRLLCLHPKLSSGLVPL